MDSFCPRETKAEARQQAYPDSAVEPLLPFYSLLTMVIFSLRYLLSHTLSSAIRILR
jgi:hypothetical protein